MVLYSLRGLDIKMIILKKKTNKQQIITTKQFNIFYKVNLLNKFSGKILKYFYMILHFNRIKILQYKK